MNEPNDPGNPYRQPPANLVSSADEFETPKSRGCFFYGCIIAAVLFVIGLILTGIAVYVGVNWYNGMIREYTSPTPVAIPKVDIPDDDRKALDTRVKSFKESLDTGKADEIVLTADELNALIAENEQAKDKVYVKLNGDKVSGQVSLPLDGLPGASGRYLNGSATFKVTLREGRLLVIAEDLEVNGKKMPPTMKARLANYNFAEELNRDPKNADMFRKFESIEIKDSKVYIKSHARSETESKTDSEPAKKPSAKDDDNSPTTGDDAKPKNDPATNKEDTPEPSKAESPAPAPVPAPKAAA